MVLIRRPAPASAARSPIGVVVLPFDNSAHARDSSRAAHVVFSEALDWVPGLRAIDGSPLLAAGQSVRTMPPAQLLRSAERLGGKYVVTGDVLPAKTGSRITVEIFAVNDGAQVVRAEDVASDSDLDGPVGRLAVRSIGVLARRERLDFGARKAVFSCTSSATALGYLLQGQASVLVRGLRPRRDILLGGHRGRFFLWPGLPAAERRERVAVRLRGSAGCVGGGSSMSPRAHGAVGETPRGAPIVRHGKRRRRYRDVPGRRARRSGRHGRLARARRSRSSIMPVTPVILPPMPRPPSSALVSSTAHSRRSTTTSWISRSSPAIRRAP